MYSYNFEYYNKESESLNGDYWKLLNATIDTLKRDYIYFYRINEIMSQIKNQELKEKMKRKIFELTIENGLSSLGIEQSLDIFSTSEIKQLIEHELNNILISCVNDFNNLKRYQNSLIYIMHLFPRVNDINWEYLMVVRIVELIKDSPDLTILVNIIESYNYNPIIYNKLINDYFDYLPQVYQNFLLMKQDSHYISKKSIEFLHEGIGIGIDSKISIGPEIEANNDFNIHIELQNQVGYENYIRKSDATVPNGDEIALIKPFHNIKEEVAKFCGLCEAMKDMGYYYNEQDGNAGGQINLGLDYLDSKEAILNFYEIYGNCEELLYYISSEEGQLFRQNVYSSSRIKPISEIIGKRILDEELTRDEVIRLFNNRIGDNTGVIDNLQYKKNSVCLRGNDKENYRFEFRIPNGGCNYVTWIDNIRLYGKMFEIAKKIADALKKDYLTEEEESLLKLKIDLQNTSLTLVEKLHLLMDLLFDDETIKKIYYRRYNATIKKIRETNDDRYKNVYGTLEPGFDEIEFLTQYRTRINYDYSGKGVTEYNPETDKITIGGK